MTSSSRPAAKSPSAPQPSRGLAIVALLLAVVGLGLSIELTRLHYLIHMDPAFQSWCKVGEALNCEAVERSTYAVLLGVPVSVWGVLGYLVLAAVAACGLRRSPTNSWPNGALLGLGALFTLVSAWNAYVSLVVLKVVCLLCAGTYAVSLVLLIAAIVLVRRAGQPLRAAVTIDVAALRARLFMPAAAGALFVLLSGLLMAFYPRYWLAEASELGPRGVPTGVTADGSPWIGAATPSVTIVEFSDYECPFCSRSHALVRKAVESHPETFRLVHRHFPLDMDCNDMLDRPFHRHACLAARAAECAAAQGKFWEMNDGLFAEQRRLGAELIEELAGRFALDSARFKACLGEHQGHATLDADVAAGAALKLTGTPGYVVNGKLHVGAMKPEILQAALQALAQPSTGAPPKP